MFLLDLFLGRRARSGTAPTQLVIDVTVSGDLAAPKSEYRLISGVTDEGTARHVVQSNGDIDLWKLPPGAVDDDPRTDIRFNLIGEVTCGGKGPFPIRYRRCIRRAFRIRRIDGKPKTRGQFSAFFPNLGFTTLVVDDANNDGGKYYYSLHIKARGCRGRGTLDPSIINR